MHYYGAPAMSPALASYAPALPHAYSYQRLFKIQTDMDNGEHHLIWRTIQACELIIEWFGTEKIVAKGQAYPSRDGILHGLPISINSLMSTSRLCSVTMMNGKSERMLRTINNLIRTLLFQAHLPPSY
ncbi:hypothetical protein Tco_0702899 [Tanacetum coccineum]|uniref:Uncharacterized protein n=1 Tax=Tanacetum coccineum TaxID=301880 RepID=A0ABQ4XYV6_9ASTR